eukprot:TRINITY_DN15071_c0_g1_i5.p1 TRINITY_DN15071_c0_g1~~TRINITY_DN15071_c0_g1_i5.p1  ORF type:complete len:389 (+),score=112.05 TRINITY_DN15071_c0_g1_i5:95-1261(+)
MSATELPPLSARGSCSGALDLTPRPPGDPGSAPKGGQRPGRCLDMRMSATPSASSAAHPLDESPAYECEEAEDCTAVRRSWGRGGGTEELLRALLSGSESDLRRVWLRHDMSRGGRLPVTTVVKGIVTALALSPQRDGPVVRRLLDAAAEDGSVSLDELLRSLRKPVEVSTARFRAPGIMDPAIQKRTTGSVKTPLGYDYDGPPFAVTSDAEQVTAIIEQAQVQKRKRMEATLRKFSADDEWLTHSQFIEAMGELDKFQVPKYELVALIQILDPGKKGRVSIRHFIELFSSEYLKGKACRATIGGNVDGRSNTLQWPSSLNDSYDRRRLMEGLRNRRAPKLKIAVSARERAMRRRMRDERARAGAETASPSSVQHTPRPPPPRKVPLT